MFRKLIASFALALCATVSYAGNTVIDTSGLSDAQIAELKAQAAKTVAESAKKSAGGNIVEQAATNPGAAVTLAATWGQQAAQAAEGFAKALGIAAKELNVTINDFLKSDAGKLTAALIIWKVAGSAIVGILYGILFVIVGLTFARVIYKRLFTRGYEKVEYSYFGGFFKGTKMMRIPKGIGELKTDGEWMSFWVLIFGVAATMIIGGIIIT